MQHQLWKTALGCSVPVPRHPTWDPSTELPQLRGASADLPHLSTMKVEALWLTEAECSAQGPLGSSRVWTV